MREKANERYLLEKSKGFKKSMEVEEAVRRFQRRQSERVLPLLGKKTAAAAAGVFLRSLSRRRRPMYLARRVQRARLSSRRRFFTGADVSRAVHTTSYRLRDLRRGEKRGR